jgi:hypothetical protein
MAGLDKVEFGSRVSSPDDPGPGIAAYPAYLIRQAAQFSRGQAGKQRYSSQAFKKPADIFPTISTKVP